MSSPKVDQAIERIKDLILSGRLKSGDRLPNEDDLSTMLDVSRNSLREAVRAMQTMRILEARQGDGTYVGNLDPANMMDVLSFAVDVSDAQAVCWFLELRRIIEVSAAQDAAARRTSGQLAELTAIQEAMVAEVDPDAILLLDGEFHLAIARIAENPVIQALVKVVTAPTLRLRVARQKHADKKSLTAKVEHQEILDAIAARDVERAKMAMWHHINGVLDWVRNNPDRITHT